MEFERKLKYFRSPYFCGGELSLSSQKICRDKGLLSTDDIKSWTGIRRDTTIEHYGMITKKGIHKISNILKIEID